jgi:hypothetical protein
MSNPNRWLVFIALLAFLAQASAQKLPWRAKQEDILSDVTRVLLVPPDVHVDKWTVTSGMELQGTSDHVRRTICGELDELLEQRKIEVKDYLLCPGEGEAGYEKLQLLAAVQSRFRELVTAWDKPGRRADLLPGFHLGEELAATKKLEAEVLIVVTADGNLSSKGEKAMQAMGGLAGATGPGQGLMIHFGVIRAQTGELLFFSEKYIGGDFLKHPDRLEQAIRKAVQAAFTNPGPK